MSLDNERANSIHSAAKSSLFDHLVGAAEQWRRHRDAEGFGSPQVQEHLNLCGLLNRHLPRLFAFENSADAVGSKDRRAVKRLLSLQIFHGPNVRFRSVMIC